MPRDATIKPTVATYTAIRDVSSASIAMNKNYKPSPIFTEDLHFKKIPTKKKIMSDLAQIVFDDMRKDRGDLYLAMRDIIHSIPYLPCLRFVFNYRRDYINDRMIVGFTVSTAQRETRRNSYGEVVIAAGDLKAYPLHGMEFEPDTFAVPELDTFTWIRSSDGHRFIVSNLLSTDDYLLQVINYGRHRIS